MGQTRLNDDDIRVLERRASKAAWVGPGDVWDVDNVFIHPMDLLSLIGELRLAREKFEGLCALYATDVIGG